MNRENLKVTLKYKKGFHYDKQELFEYLFDTCELKKMFRRGYRIKLRTRNLIDIVENLDKDAVEKLLDIFKRNSVLEIEKVEIDFTDIKYLEKINVVLLRRIGDEF